MDKIKLTRCLFNGMLGEVYCILSSKFLVLQRCVSFVIFNIGCRKLIVRQINFVLWRLS